MAPHVVLKYSSTENMAASSGAVFCFRLVHNMQMLSPMDYILTSRIPTKTIIYLISIFYIIVLHKYFVGLIIYYTFVNDTRKMQSRYNYLLHGSKC